MSINGHAGKQMKHFLVSVLFCFFLFWNYLHFKLWLNYLLFIMLSDYVTLNVMDYVIATFLSHVI